VFGVHSSSVCNLMATNYGVYFAIFYGATVLLQYGTCLQIPNERL